MPYTPDELREALRQIESALAKTRACAGTLAARPRCKSQLTLARRRIRALEISSELIQRALRGEAASTPS
jgi:hypothetical protein